MNEKTFAAVKSYGRHFIGACLAAFAVAGGAGAGGLTSPGGIGLSTWSSWGLATSSGQNSGGTVYYAGGGAWGNRQNATGGNPPGGLGGGGQGAYGGSSGGGTGGNGMQNTGGGAGGAGAYTGNGNNGTASTGGGAGGYSSGTGGAGGSGLVIVRTPGSYTAASTTNSPTRYESGGYTYYKFTSTGTITI